MTELAEAKQVEPEEWELKFPCPSLEDLRERLRDLDAERLSAASAEDNRVYDQDNRLRKEGKLASSAYRTQGVTPYLQGPCPIRGPGKDPSRA